MSENATTYSSESETGLERNDRVESYADRLLDDLFAEVDRSLDRSRTLPDRPLQPETVSLKPLQIPQIVVRPQVAPSPPTTDPLSATEEGDNRAGQLFDKLLLGAACTFLATALGLAVWSRSEGRSLTQLFDRQGSPQENRQPAPAQTDPIPANPQARARAEFLNYMQRSLHTIERENAPPGTATSVPAPPPALLPPPGNLPATLTVPIDPTSLESMATSLGQIAASLEAGSASALQPPPLPVPSTSTPPPPSSNAVVPNIGVPVPPRLSANTPPARPAPVPSPTAAAPPAPPSPTNKPENAEEPSAATVTPAPEPEPIHELIGILELGERSAALFTIEGVSRRIYIGERIGASGWTLVGVGDERVTIRRNGEVRAIYINQRF